MPHERKDEKADSPYEEIPGGHGGDDQQRIFLKLLKGSCTEKMKADGDANDEHDHEHCAKHEGEKYRCVAEVRNGARRGFGERIAGTVLRDVRVAGQI